MISIDLNEAMKNFVPLQILLYLNCNSFVLWLNTELSITRLFTDILVCIYKDCLLPWSRILTLWFFFTLLEFYLSYYSLQSKVLIYGKIKNSRFFFFFQNAVLYGKQVYRYLSREIIALQRNNEIKSLPMS